MELNSLRSVYFLGIGGIGMSALARYFIRRGILVAGYDRTPTVLTDQLSEEGMRIHFEEDVTLIPTTIDLVIYTPAIPVENEEYRYLAGSGIPMKKRAEILGMIASGYKTIAVAGTHGKTTTSTMIAHMLGTAGLEHIAFLGGILKNDDSNFLSSKSALDGSPSMEKGSHASHPVYCVVEADEYDRSFLQLSPDIAIITSADADHLDIYGNHSALQESFEAFTGKIREKGSLIMKLGLTVKPLRNHFYFEYAYSLNQEATFFAKNIRLEREVIHFDFVTPTEIIENMTLGVPGMFNLENAVAAMAAGYLAGISTTDLARAILSYQGVRRRFDFRIRRKDFVYIDDYAHHPEELRACIGAARELYPGKRITAVFQPHLFSRTRDLADDFARSLEMADDLILLDIYPAREKPIPGITSRFLMDKINLARKSMVKKESIIDELKSRKPEVLLTLGAGDIDQLVAPIENAFKC
ncbi:MAG: UDP-N-acetylmuramate--L-alanine ligase [bacterium]